MFKLSFSLLLFLFTTFRLVASEDLLLTGNNFRSYCDHFLDLEEAFLDPRQVKGGDTVFVSTPLLHTFFKDLHPQISNPYILVSHDDDYPVPGPFTTYLNDPKIIAWFGQNVEKVKHPKLHPLPIGLQNKKWWWLFGDYQTMSNKLSEPQKSGPSSST